MNHPTHSSNHLPENTLDPQILKLCLVTTRTYLHLPISPHQNYIVSMQTPKDFNYGCL